MEKSKTHKLCSVSVEFSHIHDFKFLVPNHLVDENGNIDEEIKQKITEKFELQELIIDDCDRSFGISEGSARDSFSVDKEIGDDDAELHIYQVFGE